MPTQKPAKKPVKKTVAKKPVRKADKTTWEKMKPRLAVGKSKLVSRVRGLRKRRPHRSFQMTKRRDYKRSLELPGYWSFTNHVRRTLWKNRKLFGSLILTYIVAIVVIGGFGAQQNYDDLVTALREGSGDLFQGNFGSISEAALLLTASVTTGLSPNLTEAQSIVMGIVFFYVWLATIWLLRNVLAGHKPKLRDGLYNSGSPAVATIAVGFIMVIQMIPAAVGLVILSSAQVSGMTDTGVVAMLVWASVIALGLTSIYWIVSSFIALVVVTLPGMYPMAAIRAAGDMVSGRRLRVLYRLVWLFLTLVVSWAVLVIPVILFDNWLKNVYPAISWFPLVPLVFFSLASVSVIFITSYIYLLYRKIVDDETPPA